MWFAHKGGFRNRINGTYNACLVGFQEGSQSGADVGKVCYCYYSDGHGRREPLWVIVDQDTPHLEIGYAEFELYNERFYIDNGVQNFHPGDKGHYLFRTYFQEGGAPTAMNSLMLTDIPHDFLVVNSEDGGKYGNGYWYSNESLPDIPTDFSLSSAGIADQLSVSMHPAGSYLNDPVLSSLTPTLWIKYDFMYKIPDSDPFAESTVAGEYCKCWTDTPIKAVGDLCFRTSGEEELRNVFQSPLNDDNGNVVFYSYYMFFKEFNCETYDEHYNPISFAMLWSNERQAWFHERNGTTLEIKRSGSMINGMLKSKDGSFSPKTFTCTEAGRSLFTGKINYLKNHLYPDNKKLFLIGDQMVVS